MSTTIEVLELEIQSNAKNAVSGIDALTQSLTKLRNATKGGLGLSGIASQIKEISAATASINPNSTNNVSGLAKALGTLGSIRIPSSIAPRITELSNALQGANFDIGRRKIEAIVPALRSLANLPKPNLRTYISNITKLETALGKLNKIDIKSVSDKIKELAVAFKPLADEMQKVANGFSSFPDKIQRLLKVTSKMNTTTFKASFRFTDLYHKVSTLSRGFKLLYSTIEKSNDYVENLNLFEVAMGEYAYSGMEFPEKVKDAMGEGQKGAMDYAELVSEAMGVDSSEWIRSQGVFMTMATGFGIASDRAALMSQNLTQLGYDLSSFYNMDIEDAMTKLKSGLAGELEPLRAIGYDLSQAKLEAVALELGIDKAVTSMTQAEKAQLRYYAIMTQVTASHGDLAKTLKDPANQIRVLKAQFTMAAREIGNIFIPVLNSVLPIAIAVTKVIRTLAQTIASLSGYVPPEIEKGAVAMVENTDAVTESLQESQEEAKKLKSYMLGFDELNVINPNTNSGIDDSGSEFEFDLPDYTEQFWEKLAENPINEIVEDMKEWLGITEDIDSWGELLETRFGNILVTVGYIGAALALWKIGGTVLSFIRNFERFAGALKYMGAIGVIGAAIAGASWLVINAEDTTEKINGILSAVPLVLGAILAFTGVSVPLGIALMAGGAVSMATQIALKTEALSDEVKGVIALISGAVSEAFLVVGAILAFSGANIPLGIGLILSGATIMATAIAPNWNKLSDSVQDTISAIFAIASPALLVLGAILAFSGANVPLGIGLMLAGAVSLGTASALNWDALPDLLRGPVGDIVGIVSTATLALGALLAFTGANVPLGIALMLMGAGGLATVAAVNWNTIEKALEGPVGDIANLVGGASLALGSILTFTGAAVPLGIALMVLGAAELTTVSALNWDRVKEDLETPVGAITTFIGGSLLALGAILAFSGVGIPLGIGLMFTGAGTLGAAVSIDWSSIQRLIDDVIEQIRNAVSNWWDGLFGGNKAEVDVGMNARVGVSAYATGAFDIPAGELFVAREAGAEMVGSIGRRTAVANNDQIVSGIAGGVAEANEEQNALLREQNSLLRSILEKDSGVYLDGKNLTNSVEKYQRERGRVLITGGVI